MNFTVIYGIGSILFMLMALVCILMMYSTAPINEEFNSWYRCSVIVANTWIATSVICVVRALNRKYKFTTVNLESTLSAIFMALTIIAVLTTMISIITTVGRVG